MWKSSLGKGVGSLHQRNGYSMEHTKNAWICGGILSSKDASIQCAVMPMTVKGFLWQRCQVSVYHIVFRNILLCSLFLFRMTGHHKCFRNQSALQTSCDRLDRLVRFLPAISHDNQFSFTLASLRAMIWIKEWIHKYCRCTILQMIVEKKVAYTNGTRGVGKYMGDEYKRKKKVGGIRLFTNKREQKCRCPVQSKEGQCCE